jgi:hypothetical protein
MIGHAVIDKGVTIKPLIAALADKANIRHVGSDTAGRALEDLVTLVAQMCADCIVTQCPDAHEKFNQLFDIKLVDK